MKVAEILAGPFFICDCSTTNFGSLSKEQQKLSVEFASAAGSIVNEYIKGEERSFTIIAFPTPEVGDNYPEIFDEIAEKVKANAAKLYAKTPKGGAETKPLATPVIMPTMPAEKAPTKQSMRAEIDITVDDDE